MSSGDCVVPTEGIQTVVSDAGPLIHLDELQCIDLLSDFSEVWVPATVAQEALQHRPELRKAPAFESFRCPADRPNHPDLKLLARSFGLHRGEMAALTLLRHLPSGIFLTDDAAARLAAKSLGYRTHGTIGLLLRAIRRHLRSRDEVIEILEELPDRSSLHIQKALLEEVLEQLRKSS